MDVDHSSENDQLLRTTPSSAHSVQLRQCATRRTVRSSCSHVGDCCCDSSPCLDACCRRLRSCGSTALGQLHSPHLWRRLAYRVLPPLRWLPHYSWAALAGDALAGTTVGLTVLPQALAYAGLAGLPPQFGLYSAFMGCFVYAIFGSAKDVSVGPTAVMALLVNQFATSPVPRDATLAVLLTFVCGIIQMLLGILHLGFVVNFIPYPVINSFTSAAAVTIALGEIRSLVGVSKVRRPFFESMYDTFAGLHNANVWDAGMAAACIILLLAFGVVKKRWVEPQLQFGRQVPKQEMDVADEQLQASSCTLLGDRQPVPAVAASVADRLATCRRVGLWALSVTCTARNAVVLLISAGVAAVVHASGVGASFTLTQGLEDGLPPFRVPAFSIDAVVNGTVVLWDAQYVFQSLASGFVVVSLIGILEHVAVSQAFARINNYKVDPNQEILALGIINVLSSFVSSYPITASFSKSAISAASGVQTPSAGLWTGSIVLIALAFLAPYFAYIPSSALASVIVVSVLDMVDVRIVADLWRVRRVELLPYGLTFLLSFPWGIEYGILSGTALSLIMLLYRIARPEIVKSHQTLGSYSSEDFDRRAMDATAAAACCSADGRSSAAVAEVGAPRSQPRVVVVRPRGGSLTYPSAQHTCDELVRASAESDADAPSSCDVVLDCVHVACIDYTAVHGLLAVANAFEKHGARLFIVSATVFRCYIDTMDCQSSQEFKRGTDGLPVGSVRGHVSELDDAARNLVAAAVQAKDNAYCPYSNFRVGAAVLSADGRVFPGCNVENASYGLTLCAERVAITSAVAAGTRNLTAIAVSCDVKGQFKGPCGACRQTLVEFGLDWHVFTVKPNGEYVRLPVGSLLPMAFTPDALQEERL